MFLPATRRAFLLGDFEARLAVKRKEKNFYQKKQGLSEGDSPTVCYIIRRMTESK